MKLLARYCLPLAAFGVLLLNSTSLGQHKPRAEDAAQNYNNAVQGLYDQIDSIGELLRDPSASMSDAADAIAQQSALRRQAEALWASTQGEIDNAFRQTRNDILQYNAVNQQLQYETAIGGSVGDVLNNVAKYPTKTAFEANKQAMAAAWELKYGSRLKPFGEEFAKQKADFFKRYEEKYGVDLNQAGYSRIGVINPYTGQVYYKYYGPDGKLIAGQWQDDAAGYQKWQQDAQTYLRRQRDQKEALQADVASVKQFQQDFEVTKSNGESQLASILNTARQKQQELRPRPSESTASSGTEGDGIRRRNGYPISPDHLKIPNYNGPRWVNGRLVSP